MKYQTEDRFWMVIDPEESSEIGDCMFETSIKDLELQFRGGLTCEKHPAIFSEKAEAEIELYGRIVAMRAAQAISRMGAKAGIQAAKRIQVIGPDGAVLFDADI